MVSPEMHGYSAVHCTGYLRRKQQPLPGTVKPRIPTQRRLVALSVAAFGMLVTELLVAVVLTRFTSTPASAVILSVLFSPVALVGVASPLYRVTTLGARDSGRT